MVALRHLSRFFSYTQEILASAGNSLQKCMPAYTSEGVQCMTMSQGTGVNLLSAVPGTEENKRQAVDSDPQVGCQLAAHPLAMPVLLPHPGLIRDRLASGMQYSEP